MPLRVYLLLLLAVVALVISIGITKGELHFNGDEMRHAMTGVFARDLMVDRPWQNPARYTVEYFAKYPALGVLYWPPLFYFIEGLFFLVFGISAVTSRVVILCFALLGVCYWYKIAEREGPLHRALTSAFIFPLLPYVLTFERVVMLEIPQVALCLATIYYWQGFLREDRRRDLFLMAGLLVAAMLTSQKSIFLAFFVVIHFLVERRWRLLKRWEVWLAGLVSVALVVPWYWYSMRHLQFGIERVAGSSFAHTAKIFHLFYYPERIQLQLGFLLTLLGVAGLIWSLFRAPREHRFFLVWVFSCYFCYTLIQEKATRHTTIWIPPLVYFAVVALEKLVPRKKWLYAACTLLALYTFSKALLLEVAKVEGVQEAAKFLVAQPESDVVYYQGYLNGDFVFYVRKYDPEKRRVVAREKQVVVTKVMYGYGSREVLRTPEQVLDFFRTWGIRYALVENREMLPGLAPVRQVLQSDQFEFMRDFALRSNNEYFKDQRLLLYRYRGELRRTEKPVFLPMLTLRKDIRADLNRLAGRPWPN